MPNLSDMCHTERKEINPYFHYNNCGIELDTAMSKLQENTGITFPEAKTVQKSLEWRLDSPPTPNY